LSKPVYEQQHEPLGTLSGAFSGGAQLNWSVIEKESYPILKMLGQFDHIEHVNGVLLMINMSSMTMER